MRGSITAAEASLIGDQRSQDTARTLTHMIDAAMVMTATLCVLAAVGVDEIVGRRWFVAVFALFAPGWGLIRACGRRISSVTVFLAAATSLAVMQLAGHLAVTVFEWHWAPVMVVLGVISIAATGYGWFLDDVGLTVGAPPAEPTGLVTAAPRLRLRHRHLGTPPLPRQAPVRQAAVIAVGTLGAAMGFYQLTRVDLANIGKLGLYPALPVLLLISIGVVAWAAAVVADGTRRGRMAFAGLMAAFIGLLFGSVGIIEPHPRFTVAWLHVGFVDAIAQNGQLLTDVDARFSWPGFFAGGALIQRMSGTEDVLWLVRFYPVVSIGLLVLGMWALGRLLGIGEEACATAGVIFVVTNWSGQDYFSPQSVSAVIYLAVVVLLIGLFPGPGPAPDSRLARSLRWRPLGEIRPLVGVPRTIGMLIILLLSTSIVVSHQLTPMFLTGVLVVLGFSKLTSLRWIGVTVGLITISWLSFGSEAWWTGHLDALLGPLGNVNDIVQENVSGRAAGAIPERAFIVRLRMLTTLAVWATAASAFVLARRRGLDRSHLVLGVLLVSVIPPLVVQPYGGELLIRIFLFSSAPACLLIGTLVAQRRFLLKAVLGVAAAALVPVFFLTRYGNEVYEIITDEQIAVSDALLEMAPDDSVVVTGNNIALVAVDRVEAVVFVDGQAATTADFDARVKAADQRPHTFVYFTESQELYDAYTQGLPADWLRQLYAELVATGDYKVRYHQGANAILELIR